MGVPGRKVRAVRWMVACFVVLLLAASAHGADPRAESLFQEALTLMQDGNFTEACPKLRASHEIEAKSGTLLLLANCHEQVGKLASAWAEYKEAATLAKTEGRPENVDKGTELALAVEPKVSKVTIEVGQPVVDLAITLDGTAVPAGTYGVPMAVDPGDHLVAASAPGHEDWSATVPVGADADRQTIAVPLLVKLAAPPPTATATAPAATGPVPPMPPPPPPPGADQPPPEEGGVPVWAWVSGGIGVAALVASVIFRVDQLEAGSELDNRCGGEDRLACEPGYDFESDRAREARSFGLFVGLGAGGLVALAAAIVGIVTAPDNQVGQQAWQASPWATPNSAGTTLHLRW